MALDQIATMHALGFNRFSVAGHDRGARLAYRLALDHPGAVDRIAVLDVVPTAEMWANATAQSAFNAYHWYFLAQPHALPERLIAGNPDFYLEATLKSWAAKGFSFPEENLADYRAFFAQAASIHGMCEDYRAGWSRDREADEVDRGTRKITAPLLVIWGEQYDVAKAKPIETWREWADDVQGEAVPGGHFQLEEAPRETLSALLRFLAEAD